MSILDDNIELSTQKLVEVAIKEYILKFYGNYDADGMHKGYNKSQVKIESYLINSDSIQDIEFTHLYDNEDELNNSFIYINRRFDFDLDTEKIAYITTALYNILITPKFYVGDKFTENNGFGSYITFEKILNFLANFDPSKYSRDYNFFYNKYYEPTRCK